MTVKVFCFSGQMTQVYIPCESGNRELLAQPERHITSPALIERGECVPANRAVLGARDSYRVNTI